MFNFSSAGIDDSELFTRIYEDFINWCKQQLPSGTFSTYCDGEPVCYSCGIAISYSEYLLKSKEVTP
jgi:hypothetical protein